MPDGNPEPSILVVDDEESVADGYALRLGSQYNDVETAYGGVDAVQTIEAQGPDIVLLDRRMPDLSGDEVLEEIREDALDCRVIMVTAVDPDDDIAAMEFDDYLTKPIEKEDLFAAIELQRYAATFDDELDGELSAYFSTRSKIAVLEADKSSSQLADNTKYQRLTEELAELEATLTDSVDEFAETVEQFESIDRA
jgi:DNA-binding response OmpR family regulator